MRRCSLALVSALLLGLCHGRAAEPTSCADPSRHDPIVGVSRWLGRRNASDTVWHDDTWAFRRFGPMSQVALYKAWYYDGAWHDPGELKGLQAWFGRWRYTHAQKLLFGAKRPHVPLNCTLYRPEAIVRAELHWDDIMRFANFTTNLGRYCAWGFANVSNVTKAVVVAPEPNSYVAAFRGWEGKLLPRELGGHKKRYIAQLGFVWAKQDCNHPRRWSAQDDVAAQGPTSDGNATGAVTASASHATARTAGLPPTSEPPLLPGSRTVAGTAAVLAGSHSGSGTGP